jgi:AAA15 family ATPase/GTPase
MPGSLSYSPTNIVQPKRLYSLEDNNDFARTLKSYFASKRLFEDEVTSRLTRRSPGKTNQYFPCMFINKWLRILGIADHIKIKSHAEGYGVTIHLYEDNTESKGMLLADKGFGVMQLFTVLLKIEVAILETQTNAKLYEYDYIGLNKDAQIVKYIRTHNKKYPATVALEEPECHLHPSLQSKFAEMVVYAYKQYGIHFIIESHSEYFIRKLQLLVAQKEIENDSISLLYINSKTRPSYLPIISDIGLEDDGTLKNEFGTGFFDESIRLSRELFKHRPLSNEE